MAMLLNPSTGSQPRSSLGSKRSSNQLQRSSQRDLRSSTSFPMIEEGGTASMYHAGQQPEDARGHPIQTSDDRKRGSRAGALPPLASPLPKPSSDATDHLHQLNIKKLDTNDLSRSQSGLEDGLTDSERARLERRVLLKTDVAMMPLMGVIVLLQYLDKAILSYAALLGLTIDLKLQGNEYSWAASIYYFGLIAGLVLWTLALQRATTDLIIGFSVSIWGVICMCHAATHNYSQILTVRFLLGFFESAITPAFILAVGQFYTERETISRTAIWYSFNGVALIIGGSMSWGLLNNTSALESKLAIWRQLYLILGGATILSGLLALAFMPSTPSRTRLFNDDERRVAMNRITTRPGHRAKELFSPKVWKQSLEALIDPRLYIIFMGLSLGSIPNGGVTAYSTQLLAGFGFSIDQTLLITLAPGGAQIVSVFLFVAVSLAARSRAVGGITLLTVAIVGSVIMYSSDVDRTAHTVGYCLLNMGSPAVVSLYSFNSAAVGGHGKRVIFAAVSQLAYAAGNIVGPLTFLTRETPVYKTAKIIIVASLCGAALSLSLILALHLWWNSNRDAALASGATQADEGVRMEMNQLNLVSGGLQAQSHYRSQSNSTGSPDDEGELMDKTDFRDPAYRYVL